MFGRSHILDLCFVYVVWRGADSEGEVRDGEIRNIATSFELLTDQEFIVPNDVENNLQWERFLNSQ